MRLQTLVVVYLSECYFWSLGLAAVHHSPPCTQRLSAQEPTPISIQTSFSRPATSLAPLEHRPAGYPIEGASAPSVITWSQLLNRSVDDGRIVAQPVHRIAFCMRARIPFPIRLTVVSCPAISKRKTIAGNLSALNLSPATYA
jgi:hypothetical protein